MNAPSVDDAHSRHAERLIAAHERRRRSSRPALVGGTTLLALARRSQLDDAEQLRKRILSEPPR